MWRMLAMWSLVPLPLQKPACSGESSLSRWGQSLSFGMQQDFACMRNKGNVQLFLHSDVSPFSGRVRKHWLLLHWPGSRMPNFVAQSPSMQQHGAWVVRDRLQVHVLLLCTNHRNGLQDSPDLTPCDFFLWGKLHNISTTHKPKSNIFEKHKLTSSEIYVLHVCKLSKRCANFLCNHLVKLFQLLIKSAWPDQKITPINPFNIEILESEGYFFLMTCTIVKFQAPCMYVSVRWTIWWLNFHKSVVTTPKVHTIFYGTGIHVHTFFPQYENHWSHFTQNLESNYLENGPHCKVENNTWTNLNMHH